MLVLYKTSHKMNFTISTESWNKLKGINMSDILDVGEENNLPIGKLEECDMNAFMYFDYTQKDAVKSSFIFLYSLMIFLSLLGNLMVMWTVAKHKHMRTVTNLYITNLALCDFAVALFVMPLQLLEYTAPCAWQVFSIDGLCCFLYFAKPVFVFASVLTLVAISVER